MPADLFLLMQDYLKKKKMLSDLRGVRDRANESSAEYQKYQREVEQARKTFAHACREG